jgi:hypothetical protein
LFAIVRGLGAFLLIRSTRLLPVCFCFWDSLSFTGNYQETAFSTDLAGEGPFFPTLKLVAFLDLSSFVMPLFSLFTWRWLFLFQSLFSWQFLFT